MKGQGKMAVAGIFAMTAMTAVWGLSFVVVKGALDFATPLWLNAMYFSIAAIIFLIINRKHLKEYNYGSITACLVLGGLLFIANNSQIMGLSQTTASNTAFISCFYVLVVPIVNSYYTKKFPGMEIILAVIALAAIMLLSKNTALMPGKGDLLVLVCAVAFGFHVVATDRFLLKHKLTLLVTGQFVVMAVLTLIAALATAPPPQEWSRILWISILFNSLLTTALSYFVQAWAQQYVSPTQIAIVFTMEAIFGAFFGWLFFQEVFTGQQYLGAVILLFCNIVIALYPSWQNKHRNRLITKK